jgi:anti-sigma regulatory factor (Ser/Thr protein kinase)
MADRAGFDEATKGRVAIVVTECANNLWKHAGGGEILLSGHRTEATAEIEILALDKGPGMRDVGLCFRDGYSTAGSQGTGLGAIQRLSSACDVHTRVGKGTALVARVRYPAHNGSKPATRFDTGVVSVPKAGEEECGDGWAVEQSAASAVILVVDGLGHGPAAAEAATVAKLAFAENSTGEPADILLNIHGALRSTRGAAAAVSRIDIGRREVRFAGIGNIAGVVCAAGESRQMTSVPGIVGHGVRNVREFTYPWPRNSLALLYSDGIATHWSLGSYKGLLSHDPLLIAGVLYRDWNRGRDDATVFAIRERAAP